MGIKDKFNNSNNPFMKEDKYKSTSVNAPLDSDLIVDSSERMTVSGAVNKTFILTGLMLITSLFSYANPSTMLMYIGIFGGLGLVIWASFQPHRSPYLAPAYALVEGLFVGSVSAMYAGMAGTNFVIFHAILITLALLFTMLTLYKSGLITVTDKFRSGIYMATGAIMLVYVLNFALSFAGISIPYLHENSMIGIGISVVIIGVATLNLLLDFDNFEKGEKHGSAKYMEWFSAMGLLVTLVWLYWEILRLVTMLSSD